jgi:hypothetical protein
MKRLTSKILVTGLCLFGISSTTLSASDWHYSVEPYLLAASIEGDAGVGRVTGLPVNVDFSDILETLEMAFMVHAEAVNTNKWGIMFDYGFMDLGADISGPLGGIVNSEVSQDIMELMVFKRAKTNSTIYDIYAGIRWWDNDVDIVVDPGILPGTITTNVDESWVDPVIGARLFHPLNNNWTMLLRGDVGGFGVGSDFTSLLSIGARYQIKQDMLLNIRYQGLWVDYEDGTAGAPGFFAYDTVTHGPVVGLQFNF